MSEQLNKIQRVRVGKVVSNKMDKTVVVLVEHQVQHPLYKKTLKKSTKIHAHDPDNVCSIGDVVKIAETRPIYKTKAWKLVETIQNAS
jgi:small subunit ribosomal protein S17